MVRQRHERSQAKAESPCGRQGGRSCPEGSSETLQETGGLSHPPCTARAAREDPSDQKQRAFLGRASLAHWTTGVLGLRLDLPRRSPGARPNDHDRLVAPSRHRRLSRRMGTDRTGRRHMAACRAPCHTLQGLDRRPQAVANAFFGLALQGFATHCRAVRPRRLFDAARRPGSTDFNAAIRAALHGLRRIGLARVKSRTQTDASVRIALPFVSPRQSCRCVSV